MSFSSLTNDKIQPQNVKQLIKSHKTSESLNLDMSSILVNQSPWCSYNLIGLKQKSGNRDFK